MSAAQRWDVRFPPGGGKRLRGFCAVCWYGKSPGRDVRGLVAQGITPATASTMETCLRSLPSRSNLTRPSFRANRVSSLADAHVGAGMDVGAALADQNVAGQHELTVAPLHAQALGLGVTAVPGGADALLMGEELKTDVCTACALHLHNIAMLFGILLLQLDQVDHEGRQKGLAGDLVGLAFQAAGEFQGDGSVLVAAPSPPPAAPARR